MPSFRSVALTCAEAFLRLPEETAPVRRFSSLAAAFERAFLHYTKKYPGHWTCRGWTDFPDMPSAGGCVILSFLAARRAGMDTAASGRLIQPYHEFMGAMMSVYPPEEAFFACLCAEAAAHEFPAETHYGILAEALRSRSRDPETDVSRRAAAIAHGLAVVPDRGGKSGLGFPV